MAIQRQILGPQDHHERLGGGLYRDTRAASVLTYELLRGRASAAIIGAATVAAYATPALLDITAPIIGLYGAWVLCRRVTLPVRIPIGAKLKDQSDPSPKTKRARYGAGTWFIGWKEGTNEELWMSGDDMRNHFLIPGATGSGKTTALLSILSNALCQGSGFIYVDGKGSNGLNGLVLSLARKFGQDDNVLVLNFLVASGDKKTNTWNPFATATAEAMGELLMSQIEPSHGGGEGGNNHIFTDRAGGLVRALAPILVWMRENRGLVINVDTIHFATALESIVTLVKSFVFRTVDPATGRVTDIPVADLPDGLLHYLRGYLGDTGGYDLNLDINKQASTEPAKQHSFVVMNFTKTFTQLGVNLAHIFKCDRGDIDMRDVVLNRRILIAVLPSLEGTDVTNQALGRLVTSAIRAAMAQTMGTTLEGQYEKIVGNRPSTSATPYPILLDEAGYYITSGVDTMLAQGRELGFSIGLGFQEVGSFYKRLTENGTAPILGNPQLKIIERLEDSGPTKRWIESLGGDTEVTQVSGFNTNDAGIYTDQQQASVRRVSRVNWQDVNRLRQGEVIILFGGRRIYARLFTAIIDPQGAMRVRQGVIGTRAIAVADTDKPADAVTARLVAGLDLVQPDEPDDQSNSLIGSAMTAYASALAERLDPASEIKRVLDAVAAIQSASPPTEENRKPAPITASGAIQWHPFGQMLGSVPDLDLSPRPIPSPSATRNTELLNLVMALEIQAGATSSEGRYTATLLLNEMSQAG